MQPQPPRSATDALVVANDRDAIDRCFRPVVVSTSVGTGIAAVVALGLIAVGTVIGLLGEPLAFWALVPLGVMLLVVMALPISRIVRLVGAWRSLRAIDERVVADEHGLAVRLAGVDVRMPWTAVRSATISGTGVRESMRVVVDAEHLEGTIPDRQRRSAARRGLMLPAVGMRPGLDAVAHAITARTHGRVQAQRA